MQLLQALFFIIFIQLSVYSEEVTAERVIIPEEIYKMIFFKLDGMIYKPKGSGPFPVIVLTHGTPRNISDKLKTLADNTFTDQCRTFAKLGFAVIFVVRRGFGISEGNNSENVMNPDKSNDYTQDGLEAAKDINAAIQYIKARPFADSNRIILLGQSTGGHTVIAAGSLNIEGVIGIINFAGGRGSYAPDKVRDEDNLIVSFKEYGKTSKVPSLWLYSLNDHYFGQELAKKFYSSYIENGGKAEFIALPPCGDDGHTSFNKAKDVWYPYVIDFFNKLGVYKKQ